MQHLAIENLRAFIAVYELQSFTAAAQQLSRSQPAISQQLRKLEQQLNQKLYQRVSGRIELTPQGREVLDYGRQILQLNDQLLGRMHQPDLSGRVRLGITSEFASKVLPHVVGQFANAYPNITLEVESALSEKLLKTESNRFDVVIALAEPEQRLAASNTEVLRTESLVWVGATEQWLNADALPMVVAPEGCIYRRRATRALGQAKWPYRITYTNADFSGLTAAIESGLGVTVLAQSTVPSQLHHLQRAQEANLPDLGQVAVVLQLATPENTAASQLAQFIRERL